MQKSRLILLLILVTVVLGLGWFHFFHRSTALAASDAAVKNGEQRTFYCESCKHVFKESFRKLGPLPCPQCGKPTAFRAEMAQCRACQTNFPLLLHQWSSEDKAKWEKWLAEHESLTREVMPDFLRAKQTKTTTRDWMPNEKSFALRGEFVCPKCGNRDAAQLSELDLPAP